MNNTLHLLEIARLPALSIPKHDAIINAAVKALSGIDNVQEYILDLEKSEYTAAEILLNEIERHITQSVSGAKCRKPPYRNPIKKALDGAITRSMSVDIGTKKVTIKYTE